MIHCWKQFVLSAYGDRVAYDIQSKQLYLHNVEYLHMLVDKSIALITISLLA